MAKWYAIRTATRQEQKVVTLLEEMKQEHRIEADVYLPCETRWRRHARTKTAKDVPLLVGYLFVHINPDSLWRVEEVFGVYRVICHQNAEGRMIPSAIPDRFIDELRIAQAEGAFDLTRHKPTGKEPKFTQGERVKVIGGPFSGILGEIVEKRGKDRVAVLLTIFGRTGPAELKANQIEAAPLDAAEKKAA